MKHFLRLVIALLVLMLATGIAAVLSTSQGPVYTVAEVQAHLAHRPQAWVGRTLLVRGVAEACMPPSISNSGGLPPYFAYCSIWPPELADPRAASTSWPLHVAWGTQRPLLAVLRRVPFLGGLVPPARSLQ